MVSLLKSESFLFLTLPKQSDKCVDYHRNLFSCFAQLSVRTSNYKEQEDSSWLMVRWAGGNKRFIHLWYKVNGLKGKLRCQGEKKNPKTDGWKDIVIWDAIKKTTCREMFLTCLNVQSSLGDWFQDLPHIPKSMHIQVPLQNHIYKISTLCRHVQILHPEITIFFIHIWLEKINH